MGSAGYLNEGVFAAGKERSQCEFVVAAELMHEIDTGFDSLKELDARS